jgi:hypothetical protein
MGWKKVSRLSEIHHCFMVFNSELTGSEKRTALPCYCAVQYARRSSVRLTTYWSINNHRDIPNPLLHIMTGS